MATTLLTTGLLCVIAAIVGGGIELLGGKVPVIHSSKRQIALGLVGLVLLVGAYVVSSSSVSPSVPKNSPSSALPTVPKDDSSTSASPNPSAPKRDRPAAQEQVPSESSLPNLDGTTWVGTQTIKADWKKDLKVVFGADTAVVNKREQAGLPDYNEYCSWAASHGTIRLKCPYYKIESNDSQYRINFVYELRVDGLSMSGTLYTHDGSVANGNSVSLVRNLD